MFRSRFIILFLSIPLIMTSGAFLRADDAEEADAIAGDLQDFAERLGDLGFFEELGNPLPMTTSSPSAEEALRLDVLFEESLKASLAAGFPYSDLDELANAIEQLLIFSRGRRIGVEEVRELLMPPGGAVAHSFDEAERAVRGWVRRAVAFKRPNLLATVVDQATRQTLVEVLELTGGNRTRAARMLGISRPTLLAKMDRFGLR